MKFKLLLSALILVLVSCSLLPQTPLTGNAVYFPLTKGTYWVYVGMVKWTNLQNNVVEREIAWKMEVIDVIERRPITGYVMKGHPSDLAWYDEGRKPSDYGIIYFPPNRFYKVGMNALERLKNENDPLNSLVTDDQLFLDFPLFSGKKFGPAAQVNCADDGYCWVVREEKQFFLTSVRGISPSTMQEDTLYFVTTPDHQIVQFVTGLGITRYVYVHHGTVSEVDVKLIEYNSGTQ